jgi:hypothetical protein
LYLVLFDPDPGGSKTEGSGSTTLVKSSFSRRQSALSTRDTGVSSLKNCWEILKCEEKSFSTVVTGAFPPAKDQDSVIHELSAHRYQILVIVRLCAEFYHIFA